MDPFTVAALAGAGGGLIDAGLGIYGDYEERKRLRKARDELLKGADLAQGEYQAAYDAVNPMYDPYVSAGLDAWKQMQGDMGGQLDPSLYKLPEMGEFAYDKTAMDFLDPSMAYQQEQARKQLEASAAASGGLLSGKALKDIQSRGQQLAMQDYGNAYNRMTSDKNFAYQDYLNRFNAATANVQDRYAKMQDKYGRLQGVSNVGQWGVTNQAGLRTGLGDTLAGLEQERANARAMYHSQAPSGGEIWAKGLSGAVRSATPLAAAGIGALTKTKMPDPTYRLNNQGTVDPYAQYGQFT